MRQLFGAHNEEFILTTGIDIKKFDLVNLQITVRKNIDHITQTQMQKNRVAR